jgi:hypothetical protein
MKKARPKPGFWFSMSGNQCRAESTGNVRLKATGKAGLL